VSTTGSNGLNTEHLSHIELLNIETDLLGEDPFGSVRGCKLVIRGKAFPGYRASSHRDMPRNMTEFTAHAPNIKLTTNMWITGRDGLMRHWYIPSSSRRDMGSWFINQRLASSKNIPERKCLLLCTEQAYGFLVLGKVDEPNIYERLDMFWFPIDFPFDKTSFCRHEARQIADDLAYWIDNGEEEEFVLV
jgi:hypothetical protein